MGGKIGSSGAATTVVVKAARVAINAVVKCMSANDDFPSAKTGRSACVVKSDSAVMNEWYGNEREAIVKIAGLMQEDEAEGYHSVELERLVLTYILTNSVDAIIDPRNMVISKFDIEDVGGR